MVKLYQKAYLLFYLLNVTTIHIYLQVAVWEDKIAKKSTAVNAQKPSKISSSSAITNLSTQSLPKLVDPPIIAACHVETAAHSPLPQTMALGSAILKRCSVTVKRLTQAELEKYGCKDVLIKTTSSPVSAMPSPVKFASPPKCSRFTVEISPSLYAARLSASASELVTEDPLTTPDKSTKWLPLSSSLSRQCLPSIRTSNRLNPKDGELSLCQKEKETRSLKNVGKLHLLNDSPPSSPHVLTTESCGTSNDESNCYLKSKEPNSALKSSSSRKTQSLLSKPNIALHSFARLMKDDLSSDDYHSPANTDGYYTPDG